jgi:HEAT repeat protein
MRLITPVFAIAAVVLLAQQAMPQGYVNEMAAAEGYYEQAGAIYDAAHPQDPADSLYRAARERLNRNAYREAARMFQQLYDSYPRSSYAAQSVYYQAFSLYRMGGTSDLRAARAALRYMESEYSDAEGAYREAQQLLARVQAELAQRGDEEAARDVSRRARELDEERAYAERRQRELDEENSCSSEDELRMAALNGLINMDPESAKPILRRVLERTDDCAEIRMHALMVLSQHASEEELPTMLHVAQNDPSRDVRAQAVMWMMNIPGDAAIGALQEILLESDDQEIQQAAMMALAQHRDERAQQALRDYALRDDVEPELRAQAIMWVGHHGTPESKAFLREVYESTEDREIKEGIFMTLATQYGHEDSETAQWMIGIALDENEDREIRQQAMFWAAQAGVPAAQLAELYDTVEDREMKEAILFSLIQSDDEGTVDVLLRIAREEEDPELRANVVFWLSQKDDERVKEFLIELIEGGGGS